MEDKKEEIRKDKKHKSSKRLKGEKKNDSEEVLDTEKINQDVDKIIAKLFSDKR